MILRRLSTLYAVAILAVGPSVTLAVSADRNIAGPVRAEVIRVVDGDTLLVNATPWPDQSVTTYVRLRGIDAPEMRDRCVSTREAGLRAHDALAALVHSGATVLLSDISGDKYYGRILANVRLDGGMDPAAEMLRAGLVWSYGGGWKTKHPCATADR